MPYNRYLISLRFRRDDPFDAMLDQWPVIITPPSPPPNHRIPFAKLITLLSHSPLNSLQPSQRFKIRVINLLWLISLLLSRGPPPQKELNRTAVPLSSRTRVRFLIY